MKKILAVATVCGLLAWPAFAASPEVDAAIKTYANVASNPDKLKTYCEMSKTMADAGDEEDEAKIATLDKKIMGYMEALGSDFETAFKAGADLDPEAADGRAYDGALDDLDKKCS